MTATRITRTSLVVDGNNILTRAAFAAKASNLRLSSHDGVPTAALTIFINLLAKYVRQERPDNLVVCWDGGRSTYRTGLFSGYKAGRADRPDEEEAFKPFSQAKEFLTLAGIHHVERAGVEADDLVAAYWRGKHSSERMVILSADKDFLQLLDGWTEQVRPGTGADERWTRSRVRMEMGCLPENLRQVMALTGDSSDNVPGIPGFGTKTAVKYLAKHDWDLERLLASGDPKIFGRAADVRRNLALVRLPNDGAGGGTLYVPKFNPTSLISLAWPSMEEFLVRYDLAHVRDQVVAGTMWSSTPANLVPVPAEG